jgi:hypothetical protein
MQLEEERAEGRRQRAESDEFSVCRNCARTLVAGLPSSFILHPSSFILHPSSFILHPSSFILHPSSSILHPSSFCLLPSACSLLYRLALCAEDLWVFDWPPRARGLQTQLAAGAGVRSIFERCENLGIAGQIFVFAISLRLPEFRMRVADADFDFIIPFIPYLDFATAGRGPQVLASLEAKLLGCCASQPSAEQASWPNESMSSVPRYEGSVVMISPIEAKSLANVGWIEHQMLEHIKNALRVTIAWRAPAVTSGRKLSSVRFAMKSFDRHLRRVINIEEEDGYLFDLTDSKPNQQHQVERLQLDHRRFRMRTTDLLDQLNELSDWQTDELEEVCRQIGQLLEDVDRHDSEEISLLQEAVLFDEGGEG